MKPFLCIFVLAFTLGACTTPPGGELPMVDQVRARALALCKFVPTIDAVTELLQAASGTGSAFAIAEMICAAVTKGPMPAAGLPAARAVGAMQVAPSPTVTVNNVVIRGVFVR